MTKKKTTESKLTLTKAKERIKQLNEELIEQRNLFHNFYDTCRKLSNNYDILIRIQEKFYIYKDVIKKAKTFEELWNNYKNIVNYKVKRKFTFLHSHRVLVFDGWDFIGDKIKTKITIDNFKDFNSDYKKYEKREFYTIDSEGELIQVG